MHRYDGVIINEKELPKGVRSFRNQLQFSLDHWKSIGKKGIWLKLNLENVEFVPVAAELGFEYHHARRDYSMMVAWLAPEESTIPQPATTHVGISALVLYCPDSVDEQVSGGQVDSNGLSQSKWKCVDVDSFLLSPYSVYAFITLKKESRLRNRW